jgi:hypothetical protein
MQKLWIIILISIIGLNFEISSNYNDKKSLKLDSIKHLHKSHQNVEKLLLVNSVLDHVKGEHKLNYQKKAIIKKANQDINHLKKIKQHLQKLDLDNDDDIENESKKEIKSYTINKHNLIKSAFLHIDRLIKIEHHLIKLEEEDATDNEKAKASHRKRKEQTIQTIKQKIDHLLKIERKLIVLTKDNPKEHQEAEEIYHETEYLKGPEIHDRETFSIEDAQYRDHLRKNISTYTTDIHEKIRSYLWGNT